MTEKPKEESPADVLESGGVGFKKGSRVNVNPPVDRGGFGANPDPDSKDIANAYRDFKIKPSEN